MLRRDFVKRMTFAALASGMLGTELLRRGPEWLPEPTTYDSDGIRNHVTIKWGDEPEVVAEDIASVEAYGRRMVLMDAGGSVHTEADAKRLANQILDDFRGAQA